MISSSSLFGRSKLFWSYKLRFLSFGNFLPLAGSNSIRMVLPRGTFSCMVLQRDILVSWVLVAFSETVQEHGSMENGFLLHPYHKSANLYQKDRENVNLSRTFPKILDKLTQIGGLLAYLEVLRYIHQGNFERQVSNRTAADSKRQDPNPSAYSQRMNFPPLRLVDFLRYSIRWHVRSHTKDRLNGQSLMNSFSNHYWNIAYRKSSLKEVATLEGHFFPAYLSSALDLCLGSLIATSYTLPCLDGVPAGEACRRRLAGTTEWLAGLLLLRITQDSS
ncbi:hypothetical protein YC2023_050170 [Brassica napus]